MIDITPILVAIIIAMFGFIGVKVYPLIKAKISKEDREAILFWAQIATAAADQLVKTGVLEKKDRKQHVIDYLRSMGITVDLKIIEEVLESCVHDLPPLVDPDEPDNK